MSFPHELLRTIYKDEATTRGIRRLIRASLEPVEVDYKGCRMKVHPADNNTEFQIWRMGRTQEERALRDILRYLGSDPYIAFDVGANAGSFAVRLGASASPGSQIHAFEPNPEMRKRLLYNLSLNEPNDVIVHDCAISDTAGEADFYIPDVDNLGQARLNEPFGSGAKQKVQTRVLTEFLPEDGTTEVAFLKVDIEGFEDRAIEPLFTDAPKRQLPKLIFFEHKHNALWKTDITALLTSNGYVLGKEYGRNALFVKQPKE